MFLKIARGVGLIECSYATIVLANVKKLFSGGINISTTFIFRQIDSIEIWLLKKLGKCRKTRLFGRI